MFNIIHDYIPVYIVCFHYFLIILLIHLHFLPFFFSSIGFLLPRATGSSRLLLATDVDELIFYSEALMLVGKFEDCELLWSLPKAGTTILVGGSNFTLRFRFNEGFCWTFGSLKVVDKEVVVYICMDIFWSEGTICWAEWEAANG